MTNENIKKSVENLRRKDLALEERAVMQCLYVAWLNGDEHVTQKEIANSERWLGCHPRHEADRVKNQEESTLRQVRQIIRDLRIKHHAPILSDRDGYWIPHSEQEVKDYLTNLEAVARAQAKAYQETYESMKEVFGVTLPFFERQPATLFPKQ